MNSVQAVSRVLHFSVDLLCYSCEGFA